MNLVVVFSNPLDQLGAECFTRLLLAEVERWGGFRGKKIERVSVPSIHHDPTDRLHLFFYYQGEPEGEEEVIDALRDLLSAPGEAWGIGTSRVQRIGRP